jgi:hypothetical protein
MSLIELKQRRMRQELPHIEGRMKALISHVLFLAASSESIDARILMSKLDDARALAMQLRNQLVSVTTEMSSLRRSRVGSDRLELSAASSRLAALFADLEKGIGALSTTATASMNKPGRWSAPGAEEPVSSLINLLDTLFEIWGLEKVGQRLRAKS